MNPTQISFPYDLLPNATGLVLEDAYLAHGELVAVLRSETPATPCPSCGTSSSSVHSRYQRAPTDLPWGGHAVKLILYVRKFFCKVPSCTRRIFTERLPGVVAPRARATERLATLLRAIAFALGGEAGARLAKRIGLQTSPATLISLIRRTTLPEPSPARVLGVDDWAKRKGRSYGTALVDLQEHRTIELLPDREAETLSRWLQENPGTEVISRDRSERYAIGGRHGAPEAMHVADRWHLLSNWREALQRLFDRYRGRIKEVVLPSAKPANEPAAAVLPAKNANRQRKYEQKRKARLQAERQQRYEVIRERHAKGEYLTTISRDLGIDYKTARKYALSDECPNPNSRRKPQRMLEPYEPYIRARWQEGCKNGKQLHREISPHGFPGTRPLVARFVAGLRREESEDKPRSFSASGEPLTPRKASVLLLQRPERRSEAESAALAELQDVQQEIATAVVFTRRFVEIVRDRQGNKLSQWLCDAEVSGVGEIQEFARKLRQDEAAVRAGCTLAVSNGPTEGKITKLKAIKRQMYGRTNFDLLRLRALHAA